MGSFNRRGIRVRIYRALCAALILLCLAPAAGAGCTECEGYKQLTVKEDLARFSLEYPCNWRRTVVETHPEGESFYMSLSITGPGIRINDSPVASALWNLSVNWTSEERPDATVALDSSLSSWDRISSSFQLLERSTVEIAGIQAERATFYNATAADGIRWKNPVPITVTEYYFEYGGFIWRIHSSSPLDLAKENEVHFNHILETFKMLE